MGTAGSGIVGGAGAGLRISPRRALYKLKMSPVSTHPDNQFEAVSYLTLSLSPKETLALAPALVRSYPHPVTVEAAAAPRIVASPSERLFFTSLIGLAAART